MNWKRATVITTICVGLAAAIYWGMQPQPLEIETIAVRTGALELTVEEEGKTRLRDRFLVSAPLAGSMRRHDWKVGDAIAAGRTITSLSPLRSELLDTRKLTESEARLASASATLEGSSAKLKSAQEQLKAAAIDAETLEQWRHSRFAHRPHSR
jgi:HlyD family secretion protein